MRILTVAASLVLGLAARGYAQGTGGSSQPDDKAKLKADILKMVEEWIRAEEEKLLKEIEKMLDEELAKRGGKEEEKKPEEKNPGAGAQEEKKPETGKTEPEKPVRARGYLGIRLRELTPDELDELGLEGPRVAVAEILPGTPAEGKLQVDDVILKIQEKKVGDVKSLAEALREVGAGEEVSIIVQRDSKEQEIKVTLARHPDDVKKE